jgi:CxxC motif-containing protein (DUF1111 family)
MGSLGDGIVQAGAGRREMRTAPLWGVSRQASFLHDGRAATLSQAITAHEGQGAAARNQFNALTAVNRDKILDFLNSL